MVRLPDLRHAQRGFTYLGLLFAVALAGTTLAAAGLLWHTEAVRDKEADLLFVGDQIRNAIAAYHDKAPAGTPHVLPKHFEQLIDDKRWPVTRRHLRKAFVDPMTGSPDWGIVEGPGGTIAGVYSRAEGVPLKRAHFPEVYAEFADARSYAGWRFVVSPAGAASAATVTARP